MWSTSTKKNDEKRASGSAKLTAKPRARRVFNVVSTPFIVVDMAVVTLPEEQLLELLTQIQVRAFMSLLTINCRSDASFDLENDTRPEPAASDREPAPQAHEQVGFSKCRFSYGVY